MNAPEHTANRLTDADGTRAYNAALNYWNDTPASKRHKPTPDLTETALRLAASALGLGLHDLRPTELENVLGLVEAARTADNFYGERI